MKKIVLMLAALAVLSGCSSTDQESAMLNKMEKNLNKIEENNATTGAMIDQYKTGILDAKTNVANLEKDINAIDSFINPETVFEKNGVIVKRERDQLTLIMPTDVVFDFNKAEIKDDFKPLLDSLYEALTIYKGVTVKIDGHTDNIGSHDYNLKLSQKRAESAKEYLVSKGLQAERIVTEGHSFSKPAASNATQAGRDKNRRIEVVIKK
ncbi:OmpA family protein [uncultured Ilyobacter sp.]|uniref:OmpA family protein n=1 Tax=uncultured Ilyobacter sp. TaxID=544433 RepID=UPI0029F553A2|nr:OmpA family protein [uncultured Ilyobacter sp.]